MKIESNYSLKELNSFKLKSSAQYFCDVKDIDEAHEAIDFAKKEDLNISILGEGTNIILKPSYKGLIVKNSIREKSFKNTIVEVGGGENWNETVLWSLKKNLFGLENLALIPGTVGAAPVQNIGAYGVELSTKLLCVQAVNLFTNELVEMNNNECKFGYRDSIFKVKNEFLITSVKMDLSRDSFTNTTYKSLSRYLYDDDIDPGKATPFQVCRAVTTLRQRFLPDPSEIPNVGSFYKNLLLDEKELFELRKKVEDIPLFKENQRSVYKVPTAFLVEKAGWKGKKVGNIKISENHALVLVLEGESSLEKILEFSSNLSQDIYDKYGVELEIEPDII